jgi:hypothetical protein
MSDIPEPSEALSSDILEGQFGPTEVKVLLQDSRERVICTRTADGRILELSRVSFKLRGMEEFADVHRQVRSGTSMGKAFRDNGISFRRVTHAAYKLAAGRLPAVFSQRFGIGGPATVVDVSILVGPRDTAYADILEVYSPAVSWPAAARGPDRQAADRLRAFGRLLTDSKD